MDRLTCFTWSKRGAQRNAKDRLRISHHWAKQICMDIRELSELRWKLKTYERVIISRLIFIISPEGREKRAPSTVHTMRSNRKFTVDSNDTHHGSHSSIEKNMLISSNWKSWFQEINSFFSWEKKTVFQVKFSFNARLTNFVVSFAQKSTLLIFTAGEKCKNFSISVRIMISINNDAWREVEHENVLAFRYCYD